MSDEPEEIYVHSDLRDFNVHDVIRSNATCDGRRAAYQQESEC